MANDLPSPPTLGVDYTVIPTWLFKIAMLLIAAILTTMITIASVYWHRLDDVTSVATSLQRTTDKQGQILNELSHQIDRMNASQGKFLTVPVANQMFRVRDNEIKSNHDSFIDLRNQFRRLTQGSADDFHFDGPIYNIPSTYFVAYSLGLQL